MDSFHRELGKIVWDYCGMARNEAGLKKALAQIPRSARRVLEECDACWAANEEFNQSLEKAGRVADFFELAELMCLDALDRNESCGGHFREEYQTPEGEALRDDEHYSYVAAWEYQGATRPPALTKEPLDVRVCAPVSAELQVMKLTLHDLAAEECSGQGRAWSAMRCRSDSAHVFPGDARRAQRELDRRRAKTRSLSTTIAAKASAARAAS